MAAEIQRSLDFFAASATDNRIAKMYLVGGTSKVPGLAAVIGNKVGVPVELVNPFNNIEIDEKKFNMTHLQEVAPCAGVAVGLAMRRVGDR